ncbi:DUF3192 domain-containing protein [Planctomycetota bacterium]
MRIIVIIFLSGLLLVAGCGAMRGIEATSNRSKLGELDIGMATYEVYTLMGRPYKREAYEGREIWFYITKWKSDGYTTSDEMTPFVFENGKLIGWGNRYSD